ncbi:MAG: hypothetical protein GY787_03940, partial [Alteromonadales bacterium]|nr:hypothetical protein [Alteromonadales bacterium]
ATGGNLTVGIDGGTGAGINTVESSLTSSTEVDNVWLLTGKHQGSINGLIFSNTQILQGSNDSNVSDKLTGYNQSNNWTIDGANAGDVRLTGADAADTIHFSFIEFLIGNEGVDNFDFTNLGSISGTIDGKGGNNLVSSSRTSASSEVENIWLLSGEHAGSLNGYVFTNIQTLQGSDHSNVTDILTGAQQNNSWSIDQSYGGSVVLKGADETKKISFSQIESLQGNTADDTFTVTENGVIDNVDGGVSGVNTLVARVGVDNIWHFTGANSGSLSEIKDPTPHDKYVESFSNINVFTSGNNNDTADFSETTTKSDVNVADFTGFTDFVGNVTSGKETTLKATTGDNQWQINAENAGLLNTITFSDFAYLTGNTGGDTFTFTFSADGKVTGKIDGGSITGNFLVAKNVANEWDINAANEGALYIDNLGAGFENAYVTEFSNIQNLTGNAGNDLFVFGANGAVSGTVDGGDDGSVSTNKLIAHGVASEWDISGENAGALHLDDAGTDGFAGNKLANFTQVQNITGGSADDIFVFGANGKITGQLDGGTGAGDTLIARD